ncbi:MAG: hypothetical protein FWC76_00825 [Defluviitaleaceae bacterium]|nr:hypothetical protein [Defluviitaleaceae bacterium]
MKKLMTALLLGITLMFVGCVDAAPLAYDYLDYEHYESNEHEMPEMPYENPQSVKQVSAASWQTLALMDDGTLWTWGEAQGGLSEKVMDDVTFAAADNTHFLAITTDGTLWAWGQNFAGQLGDGTTEDRPTPMQIMENVVYAAVAPSISNAHVLYSVRSFAITEDRTLWAWGDNTFRDVPGYLGDGTEENRLYPVPIMEDVAQFVPTTRGGFVITTNGDLWGWGQNFRGHLGDGTEETQLAPVKIKQQVASIHAYDHFRPLAITTDGTLWSLGLEHEKLMENVSFAHGSLDNSVFAIDNNGTLWGLGQNEIREYWIWRPILGDGTTTNRDAPVRIMDDVAYVTTAATAAFAITTDGTLWAWGPNIVGELGDGTTEPRLSPVRIMDNVASISSGYHIDHGTTSFVNTFATTNCGTLWAWGGHSFGRGLLGDGTDEHRLYPVPVIISLEEE